MKTLRLMLAVAGGICVAMGVGVWRTAVLSKHTARRTEQAETLLRSGRAAEALGLLRKLEQSEKTKALDLQVLVALSETSRLAALWRLRPQRFENEEHAAVLAARGLLQAHDPKATEQLVTRWKAKTKHPAWWLYLRVDGLLAQRKRSEAKALLTQAVIPGAEGVGRLLRLALLCDPKTATGRQAAWEYLEKAEALAPKDPDVHSFRAEFWEAAGRVRQAEVEYIVAWQLAPKNANHAEQLAGFYRRMGNLSLMTEALKIGMEQCPTDTLRLSLLFWQRMLEPGYIPTADPPGGAQALGRYLKELPAERFFDRATFEALPVAQIYTERHPEVLYLEMTQALQDRQEGRAAALLSRAVRQAAWSPALERALAQLLRQRGQDLSVPPAITGERHPYFVALDRTDTASDAKTMRLRQSSHAFAAAYLAAGWWEAALRLAPLRDDLSEYPEWYAYGLAQALRANRGSEAALRFIKAQKSPSPALQITQAELLRTVGKTTEASALLAKLATAPGGVGFRAASLKVIAELEAHQAKAAEKTLRSCPELAKSETGQALLRAVRQQQKQPAQVSKRGSLMRLTLLIGLVVALWSRDLAWLSRLMDTLPALLGLPLFVFLARPRFAAVVERRVLGVALALFALGWLLDLGVLLAGGYTLLLAALLERSPKLQAHLALVFLGFPWLTLEGDTLGWLLRLSGAWAAGAIFTCLGFSIERLGTNLQLPGLTLGVDAACAGLNVLQAALVGGLGLSLWEGRTSRPNQLLALLLRLVLLAWLANVVRLVVLAVIALSFGGDIARGPLHEQSGLMVLVGMLALLKK